jgi:hypothetical protein
MQEWFPQNGCQRARMQDPRVLPKLHRRVYLDRVERDELTVYISFYIEVCPA